MDEKHTHAELMQALETKLSASQAEVARLKLESEGRLATLNAVGEERGIKWVRAENAEAEVARLRAREVQLVEALTKVREHVSPFQARWPEHHT